MLWLGKALHQDFRPYCFHIGSADEPPNWKRTELNRVVWKFLADHMGHRVDVRLEQDMTEEMWAYQEIGGDQGSDISIESYLSGWPSPVGGGERGPS
jgi:hypothetical protein